MKISNFFSISFSSNLLRYTNMIKTTNYITGMCSLQTIHYYLYIRVQNAPPPPPWHVLYTQALSMVSLSCADKRNISHIFICKSYKVQYSANLGHKKMYGILKRIILDEASEGIMNSFCLHYCLFLYGVTMKNRVRVHVGRVEETSTCSVNNVEGMISLENSVNSNVS